MNEQLDKNKYNDIVHDRLKLCALQNKFVSQITIDNAATNQWEEIVRMKQCWKTKNKNKHQQNTHFIYIYTLAGGDWGYLSLAPLQYHVLQ